MDDQDHVQIRFMSLGMVILDELHLPGGRVLHDVLGGSCAYSTVGACIAVDGDTDQVGCLVLAGQDFPTDAEEQIRGWRLSLAVKKAPDRESTRGKLQYYEDCSNKAFGYLTPPLQPTARDLPIDFLSSTAFHFLASPELLTQQVNELLQLRHEHGITAKPLLIWEPSPVSCRPNSLAAHTAASQLVDVFSPNHLELDALLGRIQPQESVGSSNYGREHIQSCTAAFMTDHSASVATEQLCIVRAAEHGALIATRTENTAGSEQIDMTWVDAFYSKDDNGRIVDPTGAGNAFLGALAIELQQNGGDAVEASVKASVASSFMIEQIGVPILKGDPGAETWNGVSVVSRMEEYERKTRQG